jgi:hypothetical protein
MSATSSRPAERRPGDWRASPITCPATARFSSWRTRVSRTRARSPSTSGASRVSVSVSVSASAAGCSPAAGTGCVRSSARRSTGVPFDYLPLLPLGNAVVFLSAAVPVGWVADRIGRWPVFFAGHLLLLGVYLVLLAGRLPRQQDSEQHRRKQPRDRLAGLHDREAARAQRLGHQRAGVGHEHAVGRRVEQPVQQQPDMGAAGVDVVPAAGPVPTQHRDLGVVERYVPADNPAGAAIACCSGSPRSPIPLYTAGCRSAALHRRSPPDCGFRPWCARSHRTRR